MDLKQFNDDASKNTLLKSDIPPAAKTGECMLGIDEAGRGPVLGLHRKKIFLFLFMCLLIILS